MKNIIWKKPDGFYCVTSLADDASDSRAHARELQQAGTIDSSWSITAIDADPSQYPSSPLTPIQQIAMLESSITSRMLQEAVAGSTNTFFSGAYAGKTSSQVIAEIRTRIDTLRAEL